MGIINVKLPGLWCHKWRPIVFTLVVYDFGVQYVGQEHAHHLIQEIGEHYEHTINWTGSNYCGLD